MAKAILMPKVGISVESCIITVWNKKPGDLVAEGDILFEYETDKSALACESSADGVLLEQFFPAGDEVLVLTPVCVIGEPGEDICAFRPDGSGVGDAAAVAVEAVVETTVSQGAATAGQQTIQAAEAVNLSGEQQPGSAGTVSDGKLKISPRAEKVAENHHLDPAFVTPTGPYGRIIERDVRSAIAQNIGMATGAVSRGTAAAGTAIGGRTGSQDVIGSGGVAGKELSGGSGAQIPAWTTGDIKLAAYEDVKFTGVRKAISLSMSASLALIPQLTHNFSFDASAIMTYRASVKEHGEKAGLPNITLNDMILFVVSRMLMKHSQLNAHMLDGMTRRQFADVQLGMAVDTEKGLMVPVIRNANRLSLAQISTEAKRLAKSAQKGTLLPDEMSGGTFTVSNLGAFGVESFTPVINPPEVAILGVDNIIQRPRMSQQGNIELYPAMGISLTYDHRAVDGAPASRFAMEICRTLENFVLLLAQ